MRNYGAKEQVKNGDYFSLGTYILIRFCFVFKFPAADIGTVSRFCSRTVTPDNRIIVCEESTTAGDANADGYQDVG
jgi:hypothetical protein